ncbi:hypothetical protein J2Z21_008436 [Streptomyces griseochromogenes]|uniref:DUF2304 domain-containing protein n=1 Tax=Streptomyces griseochromogenes TaxID=68214 RepID=A0A1B1B462_9ACTN|nr:DUF2304 family protein [Streptomyces griseochromogenes]ANP53608.1 hypothetical protein AVL59_32335 [Streptomyces griseochromogenes]MBP2055422.1 hypothetical protein [Streptomyces griseochromogenes]
MAVSISAVVLLAILTYLLIKKGGLKAAHAIVCTLFGFYLASSSIAPTVSQAVASVAQIVSKIKF